MKYLKQQIKSSGRVGNSKIPIRLNILFFIVFLLFAALVAQLAYLQVIHGASFQAEVNRTDRTVIQGNVPRGMIYDAKGRVLVGNKANSAITYTKSINLNTNNMLTVAKRLSNYITVDTSKLTDRDLADFYLSDATNLKTTTASLSKAQTHTASGDKLSDEAIYKLAVQKAMAANHSFSDKQKQQAAIFKSISGAYQLSTVFVKNSGVTSKEVAEVSEHLEDLPGVNIGTDWERNFPSGDSMSSIIGNVSSEKQGLPEDQVNSLLAAGYSRNDRVGTSYLEQEYEDVLRGTKSQTEVTVGSNNRVLKSDAVYGGSKGDSLNLTVDSDYQAKVEAALKAEFAQAKANGMAAYSDGAYAVAMNPKTGAILALAGVRNNPKTGKTTDDALGTINRTFVMGSSVKGATVLGAMMDGVISPTNNTQSDDAIYLPSTPVKKSVYPVGTFGSMNAITALEVSSNIYMMRLALKEGHAQYVPNSYIKMDDDIFSTMRGYFNQFGLGVKTGIDIPGETSGYEGSNFNESGQLKVGSALDLAYGNYDAYTLIQMAQYVSTIANGGYRMKPYLVQSIQATNNDGSMGNVVSNTQPTVLNKVGFTPSELSVVKQGFYNVVHGSQAWGTAHDLKSVTPSMAGKTGTAQSFYSDGKNLTETLTSSFVGYTPSTDPDFAIAIVFPNLSTAASNAHYNLDMAKEMVTDYYGTTTAATDTNNK
ncbi:pbp2B2 protein [Agrilactobacillus composti DSM 18527 = JCM 14202]|uniref:Pbp2B2 protein n=1 Tax=Agrilactobacillus composti DSM 18527 = JCM 14202 TaxID=1423734 RepID=A0A0R1Y6T7_9LACO|nr:penicillin-binding protein 2 [Agrilactobacillus composti]KRM35819.1 pbp2B2 protein [Agrilactobacillus composti DSM 18527 = JCM 14202]